MSTLCFFLFFHCYSFIFFCYYVFLQNTIVVPSFCHQQWALEYPDFVHIRYDGTTYQIILRQHRGKIYFADRLNQFRKDLAIYESITINFLACNNKSIFDLHFSPSLEHQTCRRPWLILREHIWTIKITQSMLAAPQLLVTIKSCSLFLIQIVVYV